MTCKISLNHRTCWLCHSANRAEIAEELRFWRGVARRNGAVIAYTRSAS